MTVRLLRGLVTEEQPDVSGEVCDYASSKPQFVAWFSQQHRLSGGTSLGDIRLNHYRRIVGKVIDAEFDDVGRRILVTAEVSNEVSLRHYTGFSQGGRQVRGWTNQDTLLWHYTAQPYEISLVDKPCLPSATFRRVNLAYHSRSTRHEWLT